MSDIYHDGSYLEDNPDWHEADAPWKAANIAGLLTDHGLRPTSLADVGCGTGGVLRALADAGVAKQYHGYEVSPQAHWLAVERSAGAAALQFHMSDLFTERPARTFDVVMAIDVFEHVEDYLGFLRALRPHGAHHVFHIPLDLSVQAVLRGRPILANRRRLGHLHYFTKDTALATLADAGYEILDHRYTAAALDRGENLSPRAKLLRLPRTFGSRVAPDMAARVLGGWSLLVLARDAGT
jgi:2-polyprenyl-3-methyl-5-hydroxy-6-metoxy-1,4-benzoquinol methylase